MSATYNVRAVVRETGLKPDTLRVWERRYGLPAPQRSPGGHRLYTARDIATLKWLVARQKEGMSISRAVAMWKELEAGGQDPLLRFAPTTDLDSGLSGDEPLVALRQKWVAACLAFNETQAEEILTQAFSLFPPELVVLELLQKGIAQIGEGWYLGEVSVQQEHFASAQAMRRLSALIAAAPRPTRPGRILLACPPEEGHDLSLLLLTFLLKRRGWSVVYLGARVPTVQFRETLIATEPHLVIMAAQTLITAATLLEVAEMLAQEQIALAFGGLIFNLLPELRERIPGHFLGDTILEAVETTERLLTRSESDRITSSIATLARDEMEALEHFKNAQPAIESALWSALEEHDVPYASLTMASAKIAENIIAALRLGDIDYLGSEIRWIQGLLDNHAIPKDQLGSFVKAYHAAVEEEMDHRGRTILDWFEARIWENSL